MTTATDTSLDVLLDRLRHGDETAVEEIFRIYEPYLRLVAQRHLTTAMRAKLDSLDIIQSVWLQLLQDFRKGGWCFTDAGHLKAYLTKVTRNRLIDRFRHHRAALELEEHLPDSDEERLPPTTHPRPSQAAQAQELWLQIHALCSPGQIEIVQLRQQGLKVDEIAARTGLHPSSVRRILYDLARRLGSYLKASQ